MSKGGSGVLVLAAVAAIAGGVLAQQRAGQPPLAPDLEDAMAKADAGDPGPLTALAESGRPDAQYYAGGVLLYGRGRIPADPARGCAYEEKASASNADAMLLVGVCYQNGLGGTKDAGQAKAAYARAAEMGSVAAKCALGEMLMAEPGQGAQGLQLCKEAAEAGDDDAQLAVGDAFFQGGPAPQDRKEARRWYEMAAQQKNPQAARKLGEMYASGDGGKKDVKKAVELWKTAEAAGDPMSSILVADQLFSDLTGGRKPGPGKYAFRGGVRVQDIELVEAWYQDALKRDPRPDVKQRAQYALTVLASFKAAAAAQK